MGKNKLLHFAENEQFAHVIQPKLSFPPPHFPLKRNWANAFFKNTNPLVLELGCGKGEYTVQQALHFPQKNFIGIDIKGARIWRGAKTVEEQQIKNAAFLRTKIDLIDHYFAANEVAEIWITFPDPQKEKERKRLTHPFFLKRYASFLAQDGTINLKTDSAELYQYTLQVIEELKLKIIDKTSDLYTSHKGNSLLEIKTYYEQRYLAQAKPICYLKFTLNHQF